MNIRQKKKIQKKVAKLLIVKNMLAFGKNFHMCDVGEITENYIYLNSWETKVPKGDFKAIAELIVNDRFDITDFELVEIPHPKVFCFYNAEKNQSFDVVKFWNNQWSFSYSKNYTTMKANSIKEAIRKYDEI